MLNHDAFVEIQAAERYVSGELPPDMRDRFEEHYFSCPECAEEVRWEKMFAANARKVFEEEIREPLSFALVRLPQQASLEVTAADRMFALSLRVPEDDSGAYSCDILDPAGKLILHQRLSSPRAGARELNVAVPLCCLAPGEYDVVLRSGETDELGRCRVRFRG